MPRVTADSAPARAEGPNRDLAVRERLRIRDEAAARQNPPADQGDLRALLDGTAEAR